MDRTQRNRARMFDADEMCVRPYLSYATTNKIIVRGRVPENEGIVQITENTIWGNFVQTVRMMESEEGKNTTIIIEWQNQIINTKTDDGYFYIEIPLQTQLKIIYNETLR